MEQMPGPEVLADAHAEAQGDVHMLEVAEQAIHSASGRVWAGRTRAAVVEDEDEELPGEVLPDFEYDY